MLLFYCVNMLESCLVSPPPVTGEEKLFSLWVLPYLGVLQSQSDDIFTVLVQIKFSSWKIMNIWI